MSARQWLVLGSMGVFMLITLTIFASWMLRTNTSAIASSNLITPTPPNLTPNGLTLPATYTPTPTPSPAASNTPRVLQALQVTELASPTPTPTRTPSPTATSVALPSPIPNQVGAEFVFGQSVEGRLLTGWYVPAIASTNTQALILIGAIHGDEDNATPVLDQLRTDIENGDFNLPPNVALYIIPFLNPDGTAINSRFNANRVDLNRNWETYDWQTNTQISGGFIEGGGGPAPFSEPETRAMRDWLLARKTEHSAGLTLVYLHAQYPPFGMVIPGSVQSNGQTLAHTASRRVGQTFANAAGFGYQNLWGGGYDVTGDATTWAVAQGSMQAITVEFPVRTPLTAEQAARVRAGFEAILVLLAASSP